MPTGTPTLDNAIRSQGAVARRRFRAGAQREGLRTRRFGGLYSCHFAGSIVPWRCRNSIRRYSAASKREFRSQFLLFPLDGPSSAVPLLQLHPVFGDASSRVPPSSTMSYFIAFGNKSWDNFKNFLQTQGFEFLFLSQRARRAAFEGSVARKMPVLKLNRPLARKPPAAIVSESTRAARAPFAKPQVELFTLVEIRE